MGEGDIYLPLPLSLPIDPSIYLFYQSIDLISLSIYLSVCLSIYLSINLSISVHHLSIDRDLSIYLSICLSIYLCISIYLSIYPSISIYPLPLCLSIKTTQHKHEYPCDLCVGEDLVVLIVCAMSGDKAHL